MWETVAGKLVAAGLTRGGDAARRKLRDRLRSEEYGEEVDDLATVFHRELETAIREEAEKRDSDVLEAITLNWPEVAKELSDPDVVFESETEAVRRVAEAIAAPEGHDLEADPDLGRGLRSAVKEAYRTAIASFRESIAGTDLGHELELEASIDISRQLRDLERRLEGREYYDIFPGDEEGLDTAAGLVANRRLEYVERDELENQPESDRTLVVGRKGVGKSRALAEMLTRVEPGEVEHVIVPRNPLTQPEQLGPLEREHFDGDVLLVWDDVHEESNHVFVDAVRRLDDILSEQGDELWVFAAARSEAHDEIPGRYGDPEGFWEEYGFDELEVRLLEVGPLGEIFEEALGVYEVEADEETKEAFVRRAMGVDPSPFYVETVVRTAEDRLTKEAVENLPDSALEIWENQYSDLYPAHEEAQFVLRAMKLLDEIDVSLYRPLVEGLYGNVFGPERQHFRTAVETLERKHWIVSSGEGGEQPARYMLHDLQLEAIDQSLTEKAQEISKLLIEDLPVTIPEVDEEVTRILNGQFGLAMKELGGKYLELTEEHWRHIVDTINPTDAIAHNNLGALWYEQGRFEAAADHYQAAVDADTDYANAHYNLGVLREEQDRPEDAIGHYQDAIDADTDYANAHYNLGVLREEQDRHEDAIGHYQAAIDADPDHADAHYNLGILRKEQGSLDDAADHYQAAIDADPDHADAHYNLGILRKEQGRLDAAADHFQDAIDADPDHASAHYNLGVLRVDQGRLDDAIGHFQNAIATDPDHTVAHYNLGVILQQQDDLSNAKEHIETSTGLWLDEGNYANALNDLELLLNICLELDDPQTTRNYHNKIRTAMENADEPIDDDLWQQLDELADRLPDED